MYILRNSLVFPEQESLAHPVFKICTLYLKWSYIFLFIFPIQLEHRSTNQHITFFM